MNYKLSKFNYVVPNGESLILYNFYTKAYMQIPCDKCDAQMLTANCLPEALSEVWKHKFISDGFLVPVEEDEGMKGLLKFYESVFDKTLSLTFLTTEQCNFRCRYCYESFEKGKMNDDIIQGVLCYLERNLFRYEGLSISWFGGEPLMALDVIEKISHRAIQLCRFARKPYLSGITTNGYLLTLDAFRRLLACKVYSYQITIDGIREIHDQYRILANGNGTFDVIMKNLCDIRDNVKSSLFRISIRTNITTNSLEHIDELLDLLYKEFGQDKRFELFFRPTGDWGGERVHEITSSFVSTLQPVYNKLLHNPKFTEISKTAYKALLETDICYAGKRNSFIIGSDGIVYKCTVAFDKDINNVGSLSSNGLLELDYNKLAKWTMLKQVPEKCDDCFASCRCVGGQCSAGKISEGDVLPECGYEVEELQYILKILCPPDEISKTEVNHENSTRI